MLRRFIIAIATVAAFSILFNSTNASATKPGAGVGHSHTFIRTSFNKHSIRYGRRAYGHLAYGGRRGFSLWRSCRSRFIGLLPG